MDIVRSVEIRACEGARRDFLADSGVIAYWKDRVYVGPQVGQDSSIVTPQIALVPADTGFETGTAGISITDVSFDVMMFEPFTTAPDKIGETSSHCRKRHLMKILTIGSDQDDSYDLVDPDNADSAIATLRILNTTPLAFRPLASQVVRNKDGKPVALFFGFRATFQTHLENVTIDRPSGG